MIDGDTVDLAMPSGAVERIRIIGLDTPETADPRKAVQCFGKEAANRARELMPVGSTVTVEDDPSQDQRDRYGRLLAHIFVKLDDEVNVSFALEMIAEGLAHHYVYRVPSQYAVEYDVAPADAQANDRGLWSPQTCAGQAYPKRDLEDPVDDAGAMAVATPVAQEMVAPTPAPKVATGFDPSFYIGKGDAFTCKDFRTQADAQAVLRADPRDPNRLDPDRDGIACESIRGPYDRMLVKRT